MGNFIYYNPKEAMETAEELQPEMKTAEKKLIHPEEWTYCEKEKELTSFARRNSKKPEA